jgi:hypothetical protein
MRWPEWTNRFRREKRVDPFTGATPERLGLLRPPAFDMTDAIREELHAQVDNWVDRLLPGAVDAYTGDVLDGWIEARAAQFTARLYAEYDDRMALGDALVGIARRDVARQKAGYDARLTRLQQATEALEVARTALTGGAERGPVAPVPVPPDEGPIGSTLGGVEISSGIDNEATEASPRNGFVALHHLRPRTGVGSPHAHPHARAEAPRAEQVNGTSSKENSTHGPAASSSPGSERDRRHTTGDTGGAGPG